jgi:DNA-binding response OmpR family regulator
MAAVYIVVDQRSSVISGYVSSFNREGVASLGFASEDFRDWLHSASDQDLGAVQSFLLGDFDSRTSYAEIIRNHCRAPIIALSEIRSLEQTLALFTAGIDDVIRKPVHVREIIARSGAIWRRLNDPAGKVVSGRLKVFFDGRDPEIDDQMVMLPRRERHILEYLVKNSGRRLTKTQIFNAIYGIFNESVDESVIEGHMSKLRKKLRNRLGYDIIDAKRYIGYRFVG